MKILYLTLKKKPFDVMKIGEKKSEYRMNSKWIRSRLFNKDGTKRKYDYVKFTNGYGKTRPCFIVKFLNFEKIYELKKIYSNGLIVNYPKNENGYFKINLGDIVNNHNSILL